MRRVLIVIVLLLLAIILNYLPRPSSPVLSREPLKDFPVKLGDWTLVSREKMDPGSLAVLKVDDYIMRTYADSLGRTVSLYIGWFKTQREGKTNHSPRQCLPGAGWKILKASTVAVSVFDHGQITVNRYLMENGGTRELFLFWYQGRGRQTTSEYAAKLYLIWDSLTKHRTDGALIRVNSSVTSSPEQALKTQSSFISSFYPLLSKYIPN